MGDMSWKDQMQKGSFRGVAFRVKSQSTEGGRRVARHEYPGRDEPWPEDMGRRGRIHNLELHIIGADYMAGRDAMQAALEKSGPAELTHPWLGRLQVQAETYRLSETTREGGMATFSVTFIEAGKQQFPTAGADTAFSVNAKADAANITAQDAFSDSFNVIGQPGWVSDESVSLLQQAVAKITGLTQSMPGIPSELTAFNADLGSFQGALSSLIRTPASLGGQMSGLINGMAGLFSDPLSALNVYKGLGLFGDTLNSPPSTTPARRVQATNQQAVTDIVTRMSLIEEARATSATEPASSGEALAMRDDIAGRMDDAAMTAPDDTYLALSDLRAAVIVDMTDRAARLPEIASYTPAATQPALVLAHRIHGDASREDEIVSRNNIPHPAFVPGGSPLEYLNG